MHFCLPIFYNFTYWYNYNILFFTEMWNVIKLLTTYNLQMFKIEIVIMILISATIFCWTFHVQRSLKRTIYLNCYFPFSKPSCRSKMIFFPRWPDDERYIIRDIILMRGVIKNYWGSMGRGSILLDITVCRSLSCNWYMLRGQFRQNIWPNNFSSRRGLSKCVLLYEDVFVIELPFCV